MRAGLSQWLGSGMFDISVMLPMDGLPSAMVCPQLAVDPLLIEHLLGLLEDSSDGISSRNLGVSS